MSLTQTLKLGTSLALAVLLATESGCSSGPPPPPMAKVSGKITRKGKAMPPLTVAFTAMSGGIAPEYKYVKTMTDPEGAYSIDKLAEAEYMVSLIEETPAPTTEQATAVVGTPQLAKFGPDSPLRATVKAPTTEFSHDIPQ